jgi:hypothetical protein
MPYTSHGHPYGVVDTDEPKPVVVARCGGPGLCQLCSVQAGQLKERPGDQPLPVKNDYPDVQSMVIADIEERRKLGIARYGTALQPDNGRDALRDAYEEALDLACYLRQAIVERDMLRHG